MIVSVLCVCVFGEGAMQVISCLRWLMVLISAWVKVSILGVGG